MTPAELAHVHAPTCPVRLERKKRERQRARKGGGGVWELMLRRQIAS